MGSCLDLILRQPISWLVGENPSYFVAPFSRGFFFFCSDTIDTPSNTHSINCTRNKKKRHSLLHMAVCVCVILFEYMHARSFAFLYFVSKLTTHYTTHRQAHSTHPKINSTRGIERQATNTVSLYTYKMCLFSVGLKKYTYIVCAPNVYYICIYIFNTHGGYTTHICKRHFLFNSRINCALITHTQFNQNTHVIQNVSV